MYRPGSVFEHFAGIQFFSCKHCPRFIDPSLCTFAELRFKVAA